MHSILLTLAALAGVTQIKRPKGSRFAFDYAIYGIPEGFKTWFDYFSAESNAGPLNLPKRMGGAPWGGGLGPDIFPLSPIAPDLIDNAWEEVYEALDFGEFLDPQTQTWSGDLQHQLASDKPSLLIKMPDLAILIHNLFPPRLDLDKGVPFSQSLLPNLLAAQIILVMANIIPPGRVYNANFSGSGWEQKVRQIEKLYSVPPGLIKNQYQLRRLGKLIFSSVVTSLLFISPIPKEQAFNFIRSHHSTQPEPNYRGLLYAIGLFSQGIASPKPVLEIVAIINTPTGAFPEKNRNVVDLARVASRSHLKTGLTFRKLAKQIQALPEGLRPPLPRPLNPKRGWRDEILTERLGPVQMFAKSVAMVEFFKKHYASFNRGPGKPYLISYSLITQPGGLYRASHMIPSALIPAKVPSGTRKGGKLAKIEWKIRWDWPSAMGKVDPLMPFYLEFHRAVKAVREGRYLKGDHLRGGIKKNQRAMLKLYQVLMTFGGKDTAAYKKAAKTGTVKAARQLLTDTFGPTGSWWATQKQGAANR